MPSQEPWECHPDLTKERLSQMAQFFWDTRHELMRHYDKNKGDDAWSLGCRGFSWCRNRLTKLASKTDWEWLSILNPGKRFIFGIGAVPVRFYRGKIDRPPVGTLADTHDELRQLSLAFPNQPNLRNLKWRFAIETNFLGEASNIIFAGLTEFGEIACYWSIPFETKIKDFSKPEANVAQAVDLPAPTVFAPTVKTQSIDGST